MADNTLKATGKRITAIDAFRGITMVLMIFANHEGGSFYPFFTHARTIPGFTVVDLIEPMFYFAIALSFGLSFRSKEEKFGTKEAVWSSITRYLALIGLGFLISWNVGGDIQFGTALAWGTLQGIGLAGLISLPFVKANRFIKICGGLTIVVAFYLVFWRGEMTSVDFWGEKFVPKALAAIFTADDNMIGAIAKGGYLIMAIGIIECMRKSKKEFHIVSLGITVLAAITLFFPKYMPIGPSVMTPSYLLVSLALCIWLYVISEWLFDVRKLPCKPFLWWGRNSMLMYVLSSAGGMGMAFGDTALIKFLSILLYVLVMTALLYFFDKKKWYLKL